MDLQVIALERAKELVRAISLSDDEQSRLETLFSADEHAWVDQREKELSSALLETLTDEELVSIDQTEALDQFSKAAYLNFEQYDFRIRIAIDLEAQSKSLLAQAAEKRQFAEKCLRSVEALFDGLSLDAVRQLHLPRRPIQTSEDKPRLRGHWSYTVRPYDLDPKRAAIIELIDRKLDELTKP